MIATGAGRFLAEDETVVDVLERLRGSPRGISVYDRRGVARERMAYPRLLEAAEAWARSAFARGVRPADAVLLCFPTSFDLIRAYLGAILLGARPVALAIPRALGGFPHFRWKIEQISGLLGNPWLHAEPWIRVAIEKEGTPQFSPVDRARVESENPQSAIRNPQSSRVFTPQDLAPDGPAVGFERPRAKDPAFLQLTSGSTGPSRVVPISHRNLLANCAALGESLEATNRDHLVSWLPLYHDLGLVGFLFSCLVHDMELHLLRPETFLARPEAWLRVLSESRGAISGGPNFAYRMCAERVEPAQVSGLDLSSWRAALSGAEMIHEETCRKFSERFAPQKFRPQAFIACYGLAECTLGVAHSPLGRGIVTRSPRPPGSVRPAVSVGRALRGVEVAVQDEEGGAVPEGTEGEIAVRGASVFSGYAGDPETSARSFRGGWYLTGDLGFFGDGELHVTGRRKELIIVNGQNIGPAEIEWAAEGVVGYAQGRAGAFAVEEDGTERPVVVAEVPPQSEARHAEWAGRIARASAQVCGVPLREVLLVDRGEVPRTTSGKVQRTELRRRYADGGIDAVFRLRPG